MAPKTRSSPSKKSKTTRSSYSPRQTRDATKQAVAKTAPLQKPAPCVDLAVHRIRHLDFQPKPILCIAAPKQAPIIAISRANGSVELRSTRQKLRTIATVAGVRNKPIHVMVWVDKKNTETNRKECLLIGASRDGSIFVVDFFSSGQLVGMMPSGGGGIFGLSALECERGCGPIVPRAVRMDR